MAFTNLQTAIDTAAAKQIGHGKLWFIQVTLDPSTAGTLAADGTQVLFLTNLGRIDETAPVLGVRESRRIRCGRGHRTCLAVVPPGSRE